MSDGQPPQRYQLKIALRDLSPMVWRRVVVNSDTTLAELHDVVQVAMGWEDEHLHRFHIHGRDHAVGRPGSPEDGEPRTTRLVDLRLRVGERFIYAYNFQAPWEHDLRLESKLPADPKQPWPACTAGHQACPPEHRYGPARYRAWRSAHFSLGALMELDEAQDVVVTILRRKLSDDQPLTDEECDQLEDAVEVLQEYVELGSERFDRRAVNRELKARWRARCSSDSK